jgi:DNA helicase HerA-like ATPase
VLSSFYLRMATASHVHSTVNFAVVVDEAHRVASYRAVKAMVSEQRSKGVAVILATQKPGQLPPEVETNAQTKVFLRLPGTAANDAAKRLDPSEKDLPELIRNLQKGEAFISTGGSPQLVTLRQFYRDDQSSR